MAIAAGLIAAVVATAVPMLAGVAEEGAVVRGPGVRDGEAMHCRASPFNGNVRAESTSRRVELGEVAAPT
jgi:hypothetical protein